MHASTIIRRSIVLIPLCTLALWLGQGCSAINNDRLTVGGECVTPCTDHEGANAVKLEPASGPSLTTIDRADWEATTIRVPQDTVEHHPHFTQMQPRYANATLRQRGGHPTADSAFDLGAEPGAQVWEMLSAPFWAGTDIALFPLRAVHEWPGSTVTTPPQK